MKTYWNPIKFNCQPAKFILAFTFCFLPLISGYSQEKLLLVGGGKRPAAAIEKFVSWAGGSEKAHVLIITWASGEPQESFEGSKKDFDAWKPAAIEVAPFAPLDNEKRAKFLNQLKSATGIFFTGGDQNRIMEVLKDQGLLNTLRESYKKGIVFGGTSAGTAVMTNPMMTGEADLTKIDGTKVQTREGIGLLPNAIVDQHFIKRQRENRLFGLILKNPATLGIGIDEDTALIVSDNRRAEVLGATQVMFVDAKKQKDAFIIYLLKNGELFDLNKRKKISRK